MLTPFPLPAGKEALLYVTTAPETDVTEEITTVESL